LPVGSFAALVANDKSESETDDDEVPSRPLVRSETTNITPRLQTSVQSRLPALLSKTTRTSIFSTDALKGTAFQTDSLPATSYKQPKGSEIVRESSFSDDNWREEIGNLADDNRVVRVSYQKHHANIFHDSSTWRSPFDELQTPSARIQALEQYKFSVFDEHDTSVHGGAEKMRYLTSELVDDLSIFHWRRLEFWTMLLFLFISFYFRMYVHAVGQYIWLWSVLVPITAFTPTAVSVRIFFHIRRLEYNILSLFIHLHLGIFANRFN
jgi:hypothetical protein